MIFFYLTLLYCITFNLEAIDISKKGCLKDNLMFKTIKDIIDEKHNFINRKFFLDIFENESDRQKKTDIIFETLKIIYDIVADNDKDLFYDLLSSNIYRLGSCKKFNYKMFILNKSIYFLAKVSCEFDEIFRDPRYNFSDFHLLLMICSKINNKIDSRSSIKINKYLNDKSNLSVRKAIKAEKMVDKILMIELIFISDYISSFFYYIKQPKLFDKLPYYEYLRKMFKFIYPKKPCVFLLFLGQIYDENDRSQIYISSKFPTEMDDLLEFFEKNLLKTNGKNNFDNKFCELIKKYVNKPIYLDNKYTDLFLSQVHFFSLKNKVEILVKMTKIDNNRNFIVIQEIENSFYLSLKLKSLKEEFDSTEEMIKLINNNIIEDKLHGFTTVIHLNNYTFKKPSENSKGELSVCLRLSCGHFIGKELLVEYFNNLNQECHLCRKRTTVTNYFETIVYKVDSN